MRYVHIIDICPCSLLEELLPVIHIDIKSYWNRIFGKLESQPLLQKYDKGKREKTSGKFCKMDHHRKNNSGPRIMAYMHRFRIPLHKTDVLRLRKWAKNAPKPQQLDSKWHGGDALFLLLRMSTVKRFLDSNAMISHISKVVRSWELLRRNNAATKKNPPKSEDLTRKLMLAEIRRLKILRSFVVYIYRKREHC